MPQLIDYKAVKKKEKNMTRDIREYGDQIGNNMNFFCIDRR